MSTRQHFAVVSICLMTSSQALFSQFVVEGVVTDTGSEPVQNALVELIDQATFRTDSIRTDEQGAYQITIPSTGVDDFSTNKPVHFNLLQNYPNPFNPSTVIGYELSHPSAIRIDIYNVLGRKVKTLVDGFQSMGQGRVVWDTTDDGGQGVPAGVYIYSLKAEGVRINRKMLLIDGQQGTAGGGVLQRAERAARSQTLLKNVMPDQYLLRVTGTDIQTYEQPDLENTGDTTLTLNVTVIRTVTDIDGNTYRTVKIGNQWWMAENLKVTHYRNGDDIPNVTGGTDWVNLTTGAYGSYNNNSENVSIYGLLYNWYTADDSRNIAPASWHVPSDAEWQTLVDYLGGDAVAGGKMKETGTSHWQSPNKGATDESGFSALPGGDRYDGGVFSDLGSYALFWSSTEINSSGAWGRALLYENSEVYRNANVKQVGFSVRCVRD